MSKPILNVNGLEITKSEVLGFMKISGEYENARKTVVMNKIIRDHAQLSGIVVDNDALQVFSDLKRVESGLHSAEDINTFLDNLGISTEDWEECCEIELYREVVKSRFGSNIPLFNAWRLIVGLPEVRKHIEKAILETSAGKGLNPNAEELQSASDTYRRMMGLHSSEDFRAVLNGLGMTDDDWEQHVHANIAINTFGLNYFEAMIQNEVKSALIHYPVISKILSDYVFGTIIQAKARKAGINVSVNEIQEFSDDFRRTLGLHNANAFKVWLSATGFTSDEYEYILETELLKRKFAETGLDLIDNEKVDRLILASSQFIRSLNQFKTMSAVYSLSVAEGFSATDEDINNESEYFRRVKNLHSAKEFQTYLKNSNISLDEWEVFCTKSAISRKLYERETTDDKLLAYLKSNVRVSAYVKNNLFSSYINSFANNIEAKL